MTEFEFGMIVCALMLAAVGVIIYGPIEWGE